MDFKKKVWGGGGALTARPGHVIRRKSSHGDASLSTGSVVTDERYESTAEIRYSTCRTRVSNTSRREYRVVKKASVQVNIECSRRSTRRGRQEKEKKSVSLAVTQTG